MKRTIKYIFILTFCSGLAFTSGQAHLKKIRIALQWLPQSQFAGYYIGVKEGIYKKYGFDVEIIHAGPGITSQQLLTEEKTDFASMFLITAMQLRSNGHKLVNICQLSQRSAEMFVTKDKSVKKPSDLNGKQIAIWRSGFDEIPRAFVKKYNLKVKFVHVNSTVDLFLFNGIDVTTVTWYNEYHSILNAGINPDELNRFFFADYGFDVPEDGIYCLEKNYDKKTADKFVKATLESWDYAFSHPKEAIKLVKNEMMKKHVPFNESQQTWMFNRINDLFNVKGKKYLPGQLLQSDFNTAYEVLSSLGKIKNNFKYKDFDYGIK